MLFNVMDLILLLASLSPTNQHGNSHEGNASDAEEERKRQEMEAYENGENYNSGGCK